MSYYLLDAAGFVTGTYDGPGQPANSTSVPPPDGAATPLQFVDGAWLMPAPVQHFITYLAFLSRFTSAERATVRALQLRDANVADFIMLAQAAEHIDLDDGRVHDGIVYFVQVGIITSERATAILSLEISAAERP